MKYTNIIQKSVSKAKKLFQKVSNQKWFKKVIRQVLSHLIRNYLDDIITWSKHILELFI